MFAKLLLSSQNNGTIKLRIKAFVFIAAYILNNIFGSALIPEDFDPYIDAILLLAFGVTEAWGWIRAYFKK